MVSRNTTLVPSLGLRIGPACEAGLSAGMRRERVTPNKKERRKKATSPSLSRFNNHLNTVLFISSPKAALLASRLDCLQLDGARDLEITWFNVWLSW